jgi:hypothetical protein
MTPATYAIPDHYKGDTFESLTFTIKEDGVAVDLTGATIKIDFRKKTNTGTNQASLTIGSGITVDNAIGGVFTLDSFKNDWEPDVYFYDTEVTLASGIIRTYFKGTLRVNQDITSG